jgi:PAS domain S-box-containing protein
MRPFAYRKDGGLIDISLSVSPVKNVLGKVIVASKIARDITERKRAEEAARRAEQEFRDFVENASVGMHWIGPDGIILWANRTEMDMLGFTREEYVGRHIAEFHADQSVIESILQRLADRETLHNCEARLRCKDGSIRHVLINSNVLWDGDKFVHTRCFTREVTEHKQREAQIAILAREAEHRAKNVLATVQATVHLTHSDTAEGLKHAIEGRIQALANVHRLFVESRWKDSRAKSSCRLETERPPGIPRSEPLILSRSATSSARWLQCLLLAQGCRAGMSAITERIGGEADIRPMEKSGAGDRLTFTGSAAREHRLGLAS